MNFLRAYILPHANYGYRSRFLKHSTLLSYIFFVTALIFTTNLISYKFPGVLGFASNITTEQLLDDTNKYRISKGLKPLKLNEKLSRAALHKAQDMFKNGYWAHVSPNGTEPWDFIINENYDYLYAGENLARDFNSSSAVVRAWMESPSHRENILNKHYVDVGFAVVNGTLEGRETTLVVQMFGKPRYPQYLASIPHEKAKTVKLSEEPALSVTPQQQKIQETKQVLPAVDIYKASRGISLSLGAFLTMLLSFDIWYVKRRNIIRISGNTIAHILFLILSLLGIWYANVGIVL